MKGAPVRWMFLIVAGLLAAAPQRADARITRTKSNPSDTWNPVLPLTLGGGVEWQQTGDETDWDFPFLFEYNFTEYFKITIEPNYSYIEPRVKDPDIPISHGWADLETSFEYEFLRERRYRPAVTLEGLVRWPTAEHAPLGDPGQDYGIGLIFSKDFVHFDVDCEARYTFVGIPDERDLLELSIATEIPINYRFSLIGEIVKSIRVGPHIPDAMGDELEATVGWSWRITKFLKLEQGVVFHERGEYQIVFAWEYSFSGED